MRAGRYFKIGHSKRPDRRLLSVQTGCPVEVQLVATRRFDTASEARAYESGLHSALYRHHTYGEWFMSEGARHIDSDGWQFEGVLGRMPGFTFAMLRSGGSQW